MGRVRRMRLEHRCGYITPNFTTIIERASFCAFVSASDRLQDGENTFPITSYGLSPRQLLPMNHHRAPSHDRKKKVESCPQS